MNPRLEIIDADGRPTRQFLTLVPGLRPDVVIVERGMATSAFVDAWTLAFGETLPNIRIEEDRMPTRAFRELLLA